MYYICLLDYGELFVPPRILGLPADFKEGVLFSTYATLVSTVHRGTDRVLTCTLLMLYLHGHLV